jgi:lysophospholipase L1-like esterase
MKYLALGDSYTIGELVPAEDNFPQQTVSILKEKKIEVSLDKIIAVTGWTTGELNEAIAKEKPDSDYDWVTLLIGVNNQYRGQEIERYEKELYNLISQSILFANGRASRVIILSIPDWGLTPFNTKRDSAQVSKEIDEYNTIKKKWAEHFGCPYIDITPLTRKYSKDEEYLTNDKLHLTGKMYRLWAERIAQIIADNS